VELRVTQLRGFEPLTFSLRTRGSGLRQRLQRLQPTPSVTESTRVCISGVHMGRTLQAVHHQLGKCLDASRYRSSRRPD
jgi:hypothetical protein